MSLWQSCTLASRKCWTRLMGDAEKGFYYDGQFCGTADTCHHAQVEIATEASHLITEAHLRRTWNRLKKRYPLLAARIEELDDGEMHFIVEEDRLDAIIQGEFSFKSLDAKEMPRILDDYNNGPRKLSKDLMANLEFILHPNTPGLQSGSISASVLLNTCHSMTDGAANHSAMKTLLDFLVSPPDDSKDFPDYGARLEMVPPTRMFYFNQSWSVAKQRWKSAMAWACMQYRERTLRGGHTLPNKQPASSIVPTPAHTRYNWKILEKESGVAVLENCRRHGVTFGHSLYVLCQLAHAMILHRRRKDISPNEWMYRIRQPMHFAAPINPRPYFDREWLRQGGGTEVFFAITFARVTLPSMPRILAGDLTYENLMSPETFFHRCHSVRRQMTGYLKHPLMLQFSALLERRGCLGKKALLESWRARVSSNQEEAPVTSKSTLLGNTGAIFSNAGSSFGALDALTPLRYPLKNNGGGSIFTRHQDKLLFVEGKPLLRIINMVPYLRCRPGELYLIVMGRDGALGFGCWFDSNTYEEDLVEEWLTEVSKAAEHYLANPAREPLGLRASL